MGEFCFMAEFEITFFVLKGKWRPSTPFLSSFFSFNPPSTDSLPLHCLYFGSTIRPSLQVTVYLSIEHSVIAVDENGTSTTKSSKT